MIHKLSDMQQDLDIEKLKLQAQIMEKQGSGDAELWEKLKTVRQDSDALYDEKLMLVQKLHNLSQKFVQELEIQN